MENKNMIAEELISIWKDALESDDEIAADISFFELGGNSLLASVVAEEINKKYDVDFEIKDIYEYTCINDQAEFISQRLAEK